MAEGKTRSKDPGASPQRAGPQNRARSLKEKNKDIKIYLSDPTGSGELNKGYSLGGRVGAAKRGFNKKILRKD